MSTTTERPDELIEILGGDLLSRNDKIARLGMTINTFQNIPGLVGFWPMSGVQRSTGNARDFGGGGLTLSYNGNPTYNIHNDFIPYIDLDGTGDFLDRPDETDLDILGTETIYNSAVRGLTMGGWFWFDSLAATAGMISKSTAAGSQRSYLIDVQVTGALLGLVSVDGVAAITVTSSNTTSTGVWNFCVYRFNPSTELAVFLNNTKTVNTTAIPASIFNSNSPLEIGAINTGNNLLDGRSSLVFLSANLLSDAYINTLFQQSHVLFGI